MRRRSRAGQDMTADHRQPAEPRKNPLTVTEDLDAITCAQCGNGDDVQYRIGSARTTRPRRLAARNKTYSVVVQLSRPSMRSNGQD